MAAIARTWRAGGGWDVVAALHSGEAPLSTAATYALALAFQQSMRHTPPGVTVRVRADRPVIVLVALALYADARDTGVVRLDDVSPAGARDLLASESSARRVATLRPRPIPSSTTGLEWDSGTVSASDCEMLDGCLTHPMQWEWLRTTAHKVLADEVAEHPSGSMYHVRSYVRRFGIRQSWWDRPSQTAVVAADESDEQRA